jgi:hypothetical protein
LPAKDAARQVVYADVMTIRLGLICAVALAIPRDAGAFCGFYVASGDHKMFNDATQVVMMRMGTRTVLAMQNDYKGPPEAFAMVIPVPAVLHEGDVKTLPKDVFAHVEQMGAPRLVEYWEQDPCSMGISQNGAGIVTASDAALPMLKELSKRDDLGVKIEAKFTVGEYQIVILSAKDSTGLDQWLRREKYTIPDGAEPLLRPYVESGMKFFVAKVDPQKVKFVEGRAALSPLRFHYDSDEFALPIRLGLANSSGTQDLIVNILAPNQRYQVTNYKNITIPTNIDVRDSVRDRFASFYASLFDATVAKNPGAVVTEYAWQATTCDPCPGPVLDAGDFATLGADVLGGPSDKPVAYTNADFVLTRLHARYGKDIKDDLVFAQAPPIVGGRESRRSDGSLEEGAHADSMNNFQGRYAIRHPWTGPIKCDKPHRGEWGGPPREIAEQPGFQPAATKPALDLAFAPRAAVALSQAVARDVPEIDLKAGASVSKPASASSTPGSAVSSPSEKKKSGCGCASTDRNGELGGALLVGASLLIGRRRRRASRRA